ncbi:hypothetical protein EW146_g4284 [Bondarzewia mesenterica]|uniref:Uncharacterized protein n=1 Tax=Bondarzewia mesenterica TaxID=1095465 RepID=A0A4S4LUZ2_9AGAM|nr:hypothetical protein EW146_g4284 [Bondarzewia mesenterica]
MEERRGRDRGSVPFKKRRCNVRAFSGVPLDRSLIVSRSIFTRQERPSGARADTWVVPATRPCALTCTLLNKNGPSLSLLCPCHTTCETTLPRPTAWQDALPAAVPRGIVTATVAAPGDIPTPVPTAVPALATDLPIFTPAVVRIRLCPSRLAGTRSTKVRSLAIDTATIPIMPLRRK